MNQMSEHLKRQIQTSVMKDLQPSLVRIHGVIGIAMIVGSLMTLLYCGQFGISVTTVALNNNHWLHQTNDLICAIACGSIFSIAPLAVLRFVTNGHLFRVIVRNHFEHIAIWLAAFGAGFGWFGNMNTELYSLVAWFAAALTVYKSAGVLLARTTTSNLSNLSQQAG